MATLAEQYEAWRSDPAPERMGSLLKSMDPFLTQEIQNYQGPKNILHIKAKRLAVDAVKSYDQTQGTNLRTWVTGQLRPLSRYGKSLDAVKAPELANRRAAELNRVYEDMHDQLGYYPDDDELADETGLSKAKIAKLRQIGSRGVTESQYVDTDSGTPRDLPGGRSAATPDYAYDAVYMHLGPREKVIMDWKTGRHGKDQLANDEIAARLGVSPAFISQVSSDVAKKIERVMQDVV